LPPADDNSTALELGESPFESLALWDWDVRAQEVTWSGSSGLWELLGQSAPQRRAEWLSRIEPPDAPTALAQQEEGLRAGKGWRATYRLRGAPQRLREQAYVVRDFSGPLRVVGTLSLRRESSRRLRRPTLVERLEHSEERFRTFVESIPQLAWQATREGWIYFYNQRWYDYTGMTPDECEGWGWVSVHDPHDLPRVLARFRRALETGQPWEDEFQLRRGSDGMLRWHLSRALPLRDRNGRICQWFGTNTDIHDRKVAAEERAALLARERDARRQAEEANRAKDEFLAIVSHELRTPLNAMMGWAQLLQTGSLPQEKEAQALDRIEQSARLQAKLIDDLLDVSRIIGGKLQIERETVDLARVVRAAVESLRHVAERRRIQVALAGELPELTVEGSGARLQQVLSNLIDNAIKFSESGQVVEVSLVREGSQARIDVCDHGAGIDPEFLPRVFQRFGQADTSTTRRRGGLGLGLSIVKHLVELHGGRVSVTSEGHGHGARFTVHLPRKGVTGEVPRLVIENAEPMLTGITVLGVDDDQTARDVLRALLADRGADITTVGSAGEALALLHSQPVDVIVSDIGMPDVDGLELAARIRCDPDPAIAGLPLVALTAYASGSDRDRAFVFGFDAYVTKPVEAKELVRNITLALRARARR
jgi:PAS domain S-box-containing protein